MNRRIARRTALPATLFLALGLAACGGGNEQAATGGGSQATGGGSGGGESLSGEVLADGSSTVQPLTAAAGELFAEEQPGVNVSVGTSGTGGGFEVFCQGATDISNASRPIKDEEQAACEQNGVQFTELEVATDALTVVTSKENDFITCLTTEELATLWGPDAEGTISTWNQVNPSFPNEPIELYGPGTDSGTFDYFTDEINGEEGASRTDYNPSEDDNVIVQGVQGSPGAMGYFGLSYVQENEGAVKAVEIDGGEGCVTPSVETVLDGTYKPLGRPLFVYPSDKALARPEVQAFLEFYVANEKEIAEQALYVELSDEQQAAAEEKIAGLVGG